MSGIAIKITSLLIRTVSKPIASRIKAQAREHPGFRRICVGWAQYLHRVDMRLRLGLLNDPARYERQAAREAAEAAARKLKAETPTVKTEAQTRADAEAARRAREREERGERDTTAKDEDRRPKIKPLSEAKAIDMGANFIAESFLFAVAVGTLFWDQYRSRKKEANRRNDVADKLAELEELDRLKQERIDGLERQVRQLGGGGVGGGGGHASWHWPWSRENATDEDATTSSSAAVAAEEGRVTAAVRAQREIVKEKEKEEEKEKESGSDKTAATRTEVPAAGEKATSAAPTTPTEGREAGKTAGDGVKRKEAAPKEESTITRSTLDSEKNDIKAK